MPRAIQARRRHGGSKPSTAYGPTAVIYQRRCLQGSRERFDHFNEGGDITVLEEFDDCGHRSTGRRRPGLAKLFQYLRDHQGEIDLIIIDGTTQLTRSYSAYKKYLNRFRELSATVVNVEVGLDPMVSELIHVRAEVTEKLHDQRARACRQR